MMRIRRKEETEMKRTKKQVLNLITVGYLLLNTMVMSGAVFADTVPSEEVKTTTTTENSPTKESDSPSLPSIPDPAPTSSEVEPKEEKALSFEDRQLLDEATNDSAIPAIVFQEKQLENGLTIQGDVSAGTESKEENQSQTILSALILQRRAEDGSWEEVHRFPIDDNGINVTESAFPFAYSEGVEKTGEASFRLAAEYTIKYATNDEQNQKASLEIGTVTKVEKEESQQSEEKISTEQESTEVVPEETTESTKEVIDSTEDRTVESSGPEGESTQEEPIMIDPAVHTTSPNTLGNNSQIPKMQEMYREAFQRGLGIMPLSGQDLSIATPATSEQYNYSTNVSKAVVDDPSLVSARYTSKTKVTMYVKLGWNYYSFTAANSSITDQEMQNGVNSRPYSYYIQFSNTRWSSNQIYGDLTKGKLNQTGTAEHGYLNSLTNNRRIIKKIDVSTAKTTVWSYNSTVVEITGVPVGAHLICDHQIDNGEHASSYIHYDFVESNAKELTYISTPTFTASDGIVNAVVMSKGTYTGDTSFNFRSTGGKLQLFGTSSWGDHISDVGFSGGEYVTRTVSGLTAGNEYYGKMLLPDWLDVWRESGQRTFYTPNSVKSSILKSRNVPTTSNDASATLTGEYVVGTRAAHPSSVEVQILKNYSWETVPSTSSFDTSTRTVTHTISGLAPSTQYFTRYRVKNASNAWSPWAVSSGFTTRGLALSVSTPTFDQVNATTNQITMNTGSYTGHVSIDASNSNTGQIKISNDNGTLWTLVTSNLQHDQILNGEYKGETLSGLTAGTAYQAKVGLKNDLGTYVDSLNAGLFYTKNTVNQPIVDSLPTPAGKYNAYANISGIYGIGPTGTSPAHPDKIQVRISRDDATWQEIDGSTTPQLDSQSIDTSSTKGIFAISKLKADTDYYVQYRVENKGGWSAWSASESFKTPLGPASMELIDAPKFDFGMLKNEPFQQTATLDAASQKNHVEVDNTITTKGWKLTAKLDQLKRSDNPSVLLPWATLSMDINLQNSIDDGVTWSNYTTGVTGSPGTVNINSGAPAIDLWSIANPNDAQGLFRTEIDWSSVTLDVPANQTGMYAGNLVWSLDDTP